MAPTIASACLDSIPAASSERAALRVSKVAVFMFGFSYISLPILPRPQDKNHREKRRRALEKDQQNRSLQGASRFS